jgi:hypothetical protein
MRPLRSCRSLSFGAILACIAALITIAPLKLFAQEINVPSSITAGEGMRIATTGSGKATFYLSGPGASRKTDVELGKEIELLPQDLRSAGRYEAILCSDHCRSAIFFVTASKPTSIALLVHPSRVPVSQPNAISGVALPFDRFQNFVSESVTVKFDLISGPRVFSSHTSQTRDGVAWFRTDSSSSTGAFQVVASSSDLSTRRALQQVASDPCNLRISGQRTAAAISLQTEPVHDCSGNPVSDGTVVTFTATGPDGKSTIDAPIKHGVASTQIKGATAKSVVVSAASGIVMGNEIRLAGKP